MAKTQMYRIIAETTTDGILVLDQFGIIKWCNPAISEVLQRPLAEILGSSFFRDFVGQNFDQDGSFDFANHPNFFTDNQLVEVASTNGTTFQLMVNFSTPNSTLKSTEVIAVCRDVSAQIIYTQELKRTRAELQFATHHDALTGLANRAKLKEILQNDGYQNSRAKGVLGVMVIDLDNFKDLNDNYGHAAGDAALRHVAQVLSHQTRSGTIVSRTGGDEFQVFVQDVTSTTALETIAKRLIFEMGKRFHWQDRNLQVSTTIGASLGRSNTISCEDLVQQADLALSHCKKTGRGGVTIYSTGLQDTYSNERSLLGDLRYGIQHEQFVTFLQPQLDLNTNQISGFEALIRWQHPTRGLLSPFAFLPLAEANGLIQQLDNIAMHQALKSAATYGKTALGNLKISINASGETLAQQNYADLVQWAADAQDIPLETICIEVLETAILSDTEPEITASIKRLKKLGIIVALDDFGTGYAGLAHMSKLDVDVIKIDRSLIGKLDTNTRDQKIVNSLVALCSELDINVVAEGAETEKQLQMLKDIHCPIVQGFGIAQPMPATSAIDWALDRKNILGQASAVITPPQFFRA